MKFKVERWRVENKVKRGIFLLSFFAFTFSAFSKEKDFEAFQLLYSRTGSIEESIVRFENMEVIRKGALSSLERIRKNKSSVEIEMRYGELLLERSRDLVQFAMELELAGKSKKAAAVKKEAAVFVKKGFQHHEQVLSKNRNHVLAPQLYLGVARTRLLLNQKGEALSAAQSGLSSAAIKKQNSKETELRLNLVAGDAAFGMSQASRALGFYERALKLSSDRSVEKAYALYRVSWVHYNLKDSERALKNLAALIEENLDKLSLRSEAIQDYALFAADLNSSELKNMGGPKGVYKYLSKYASLEDSKNAVKRLGDTLAKNGRRSEAIGALEFLIDENSNDPDAIDWALSIIEWNQSLAKKEALRNRYEWLVKEFGPKSFWFGQQKTRPDVQQLAKEKVSKSLKTYALSMHKDLGSETLKARRLELGKTIAGLYDLHIESFPEESLLYYYRAELFSEAGDTRQAALYFDTAAQKQHLLEASQKEHSDKIKLETALGRVSHWAKTIENPKVREEGDELRFISAIDDFVKHYPKHPKAPLALLDAAKVESGSKMAAPSIKRLEMLVEKYPRTKEANEGAHAILDLLNKEQDYVNLAQRARKLLDTVDKWAVASEKAKIKGELSAILAKTEGKACETLEKDPSRRLEAAVCYESYAKGFPKETYAPRALLVASELYEAAKNPFGVQSTLELLVSGYPDAKESVNAFARLAKAYENTFQFAQAANIYKKMLARKGVLESRSAIAERLLVLLEGLERHAELADALKDPSLTDKAKRGFMELRAERALKRASLELSNGLIAEAKARVADIQKYRDILPLRATLNLARLEGRLLFEAGKAGEADKLWQSGLKKFWASPSEPGAREAAARLRLEQGLYWEKIFSDVDVTKNTARKLELYQKLEAWYTEVVGMKSPPVALEALLRSSDSAQKFADSLEAAAPKAKASDREVFLNAAKDLKEKAKTFREQVASRALEWKVLSPGILGAVGLSSLLDNQYGVFVELPVWADLTEEQLSYKEWEEKDARLLRVAEGDERLMAKRATLVWMLRNQTLKEPKIEKPLVSMNDKASVQLKVQSLINDTNLALAELYLGQYEQSHGEDAFADFARGLLAWNGAEYETAFAYWMNEEKAQKHFRTYYLLESWKAAVRGLSGEKNQAPSKDFFQKLSKLSDSSWEKMAYSAICLKYSQTCPNLKENDHLADSAMPRYLAFDGRGSAYPIWFENVANWADYKISKFTGRSQQDQILSALAELRELNSFVKHASLKSNWAQRMAALSQEFEKKQQKTRGIASVSESAPAKED